MNWHIFLVFSLCVTFSSGYKVLLLSPFNGKSHFLYMQSFAKALLDRGHEVTFLTSNSIPNLKSSNFTEFLIDPPFDFTANGNSQDKMLEDFDSSAFASITLLSFFSKATNEHNLKSDAVQKLIHSKDLHFDVIVMEDFFSESFLAFAHKFNAPVVKICPFGSADFNDREMGLLTPSSFVPHWMLTYSDKMTFTERWYNAAVGFYDWFIRKYVFLPSEEEFTRRFFAHLEPLPSMDELLQRVAVILVNTHRALSPPRPSMPAVINIGGAHLKPPKPLPNDIQQFLDDAKHGVIYFSLGTVVKSSLLPKEKIQIFLDSFKHLKQRVLWKFEDESLTNVPSNVKISKWLPQNDILAHPNVVLFISHGGGFGTSESLWNGVPMLIIPFFGDQHRNAHRIQTAGNGAFLSYKEITKESLTKKLNELLSNKSYYNKAREISAVFKDNLVHPMDEAMFWIEHVAKFKGAKHLKSHAVHMSLFSYLLLDVLAVNLLGVLAIVFVFYYLAKKLCSKKKNKQEPGKKQK